MSNLVRHAEEEMRRAGLYDKDADYGEMVPKMVLDLVKAHADSHPSGGLHHTVLEIFNRVIEFKTLSPLTANPEEWTDVSEMSQGPMWQNRRDPAYFSTDGGKTWYNVETRKTDAFRKEVEQAINRNSLENGSDTQDFILAQYLVDCLAAFDRAVTHRTRMSKKDEPDGGTNSAPDPVKV